MLVSRTDPWSQTMRLLSSAARVPDDIRQTTSAATHRVSSARNAAFIAGGSSHLVVSLIERTTSSTVTIAWRDPTSCFYGEQTWRAARAKVSGICALSGARIKAGDRIFHPQRSKPAPVNAWAMILVSALNDVEPVQSYQVSATTHGDNDSH